MALHLARMALRLAPLERLGLCLLIESLRCPVAADARPACRSCRLKGGEARSERNKGGGRAGRIKH